jgi:GT2 family glycosyltransferase
MTRHRSHSAALSVSVVIPNFNGEHLLPSCLAALAAQTAAPDQVVVVDNGSRDGSVELLRREHPEVELVALPRNIGYAGAANRGLERATGDLVSILNSDARPAPDWLAELLAAPREEDVWAWGSVLVQPGGRVIESAGDHWHQAGFAAKLLNERPVADLPADPYDVVAPPGAAPLYRADRLRELGGWEERYFLYFEDVDLALRAILRGWRAVQVPSARVEHDLGASGGGPRRRFHVARNSIWTAVRCDPEPSARAITREAVRELGNVRRPLVLMGVELLGRLAALATLPWALRTRRRIQAARSITPDEWRRRLEAPRRVDPRLPA